MQSPVEMAIKAHERSRERMIRVDIQTERMAYVLLHDMGQGSRQHAYSSRG